MPALLRRAMRGNRVRADKDLSEKIRERVVVRVQAPGEPKEPQLRWVALARKLRLVKANEAEILKYLFTHNLRCLFCLFGISVIDGFLRQYSLILK